MTTLDFRKRDRAFYSGKPGRWDRMTLPPMRYLMLDGHGDPNGPGFGRAAATLYPLAYGVRKGFKAAGHPFTVGPLCALWFADDPGAFVRGDRADWRWTAMLRLPAAATEQDLDTARAALLAKLARQGDAPTDADHVAAVRLADLTEGECLQTLHVGPYADEAPVLADLHGRVMPEQGLTFAGAHHEIYLGDPRRVAPDRLRTLLRQPVRPA